MRFRLKDKDESTKKVGKVNYKVFLASGVEESSGMLILVIKVHSIPLRSTEGYFKVFWHLYSLPHFLGVIYNEKYVDDISIIKKNSF